MEESNDTYADDLTNSETDWTEKSTPIKTISFPKDPKGHISSNGRSRQNVTMLEIT